MQNEGIAIIKKERSCNCILWFLLVPRIIMIRSTPHHGIKESYVLIVFLFFELFFFVVVVVIIIIKTLIDDRLNQA